MSSRTEFYAKANQARVNQGLAPITFTQLKGTVEQSDSVNVAKGDLPNYDGPSERLRIQALLYHPDLYAKMNLHPSVREADQKYLAHMKNTEPHEDQIPTADI